MTKETPFPGPTDYKQMAVTLSDGREIWLTNLQQHQTYGGLLCGYPNRRKNEDHLEADAQRAAKEFDNRYPPVMIPPLIRTYPNHNPHRLMGPCEALPGIFSAALFTSDPVDSREGCNSSALIVWYQDDWGKPGPDTLEKIQAIEWNTIAVDWSW